MQRWVERSEARWALWAGIVGALAAAALSTRMILSHPASGAGFGFIFLPLVAAASLPGAAGYEIWRGKSLESAVAETRRMDARQLERAFDESSFRRDKYFLGALAGHPAASAQLLERIASLEDPALSEPMGSLWDVMGENRKGEPVRALAARHPNATESVRRRAPR